MQNLHTENYKTLLVEIKESLSNEEQFALLSINFPNWSKAYTQKQEQIFQQWLIRANVQTTHRNKTISEEDWIDSSAEAPRQLNLRAQTQPEQKVLGALKWLRLKFSSPMKWRFKIDSNYVTEK